MGLAAPYTWDSGEVQRYTLLLLLLEFEDASSFLVHSGILNEIQVRIVVFDTCANPDFLQTIARNSNHDHVLQLTTIIRLRLLIKYRKWDMVTSALTDLGTYLGYDDRARHTQQTSTWKAHATVHYLIFRCLWEGRIGNDSVVKSLLKHLYLLMDNMADQAVFHQLRANGGIIQVSLTL